MEWDSKRKTQIPLDSPINRYTIAKRDYYTVQDSTGFIWGYSKDLSKAKKIQALAKKRTNSVVGIIKGNILPLPKKYKMPLKEGYKVKNVKIKKKESKVATRKRKTTTKKRVTKASAAYHNVRKSGYGKSLNTRYNGRIRKGVYQYKVKHRKK